MDAVLSTISAIVRTEKLIYFCLRRNSKKFTTFSSPLPTFAFGQVLVGLFQCFFCTVNNIWFLKNNVNVDTFNNLIISHLCDKIEYKTKLCKKIDNIQNTYVL